MSTNTNYFFSFLEGIIPEAAQIAKKMEELIFEDPSSAIVKARLFAEEILNKVIRLEHIDELKYSNLFDKITYLTRNGYFKKEIQQSFDIIRLSGNKAAHDSNYNDITEAFKLHNEMYKIGVWFFEVYTNEHLNIPLYEPPKPRERENIEELVKKQILELLGSNSFDIGNSLVKEEAGCYQEEENKQLTESHTYLDNIETKKVSIFEKNLPEGESYLLRELRRLKDSSQEAIENAEQFSGFKKYLHVNRRIQSDLEGILKKNKDRSQGNLILLCGNVGDGKSHLLAHIKESNPDLIKNYKIFNDATESFSPNKNAMDTLEEVLTSFSDEHIDNCDEKVILAINMGVLHNFINTEHKQVSYNKLKKFIEKSQLFSQKITTHFNDETIDLLSFGDYHTFELTANGAQSEFYSSLLNNIFNPSDDNPFFLALQEDFKRNLHTMLHENYKFMQSKFVQNQIVQLVIQTIITKKLIISARAFLNFVADILIPDDIQNIKRLNEFDVLEAAVPSLLFNRKDRSEILHAISQLDPIHRRSVYIDKLIVELNTLTDWNKTIDEYITEERSKDWLKPFLTQSKLTGFSFDFFIETFIRITFLTNMEFSDNIANVSYHKYLKNLYYFNTKNKKGIKAFYEEIYSAIFKWKGSPKKDYIYLKKPSEKYCLAHKLNLKPSIEHLSNNSEEVLETFKASIVIAFENPRNSDEKLFLDVDFQLYQLLKSVEEGYRPNKKDEEDAIKFIEFLEKLMKFGDKKKEILVFFPIDNKFYTIKRDSFDAFVFERE